MSDIAIRSEDAEEYQFLAEQKEKAVEKSEAVDGEQVKAYYKGKKRIFSEALEKFGSGELSEWLTGEYDAALDTAGSDMATAAMLGAGEKDAIEKIHEECDVSILALNKDDKNGDGA